MPANNVTMTPQYKKNTYTLTVETERLMNVTLCGPAGSLETLTPEQVVIEIDADDFSVAIGRRTLPAACMCPPMVRSLRWGLCYPVQDRK